MRHQDKVNLLDFDRHDLSAFFAGIGERSFRASQVVKWIHQRGVMDFNAMTDLSKTLRERLNETVRINPPEIAAQRVSRDGTRKWLVRLEDGNCIETVFIPEDARGTLCISSQAGCALNCTFCSTARQGFNRNLGVAEIIAQLWIARRELDRQAEGGRPITNVVLMGMGEPLLNYKNVVKAITLMLDDDAYGLSRRRITVSTAGVVPALDRLREDSDVSLAVSLHAANDRLRDTLIPLNRKYPLSQLMAACRRYVAGTPRRRVTFEYVMLEGINDQVHHARELIALLRGVPAKVNLIPFNPFPGAAYVCSAQAVIDRFREILLAAGLVTVTRKTRGSDIEAACGQLVGRVEDRTRRRLRDHSRSGKVDNGCCNDASGGCS